MSSRIATAALSLVMLSACAGTTPPSAAPSIHEREFVSVSVTENGVERALVPGTVIRLTFESGRVGASAGCNHIGGEYAVDGDRLLVGNLASTAMGCDPARHDQDEWLSAFLGAGPTISLIGAELVLESTSARMVLIEAAVAAPNLPLGNTWRVEGLVRGDVVSSVPAGVQASLEFASDGTVLVFFGCNRGGGPVLIAEGVLTFGEISSTRMACSGPANDVEAHVLAVVGSGRAAYEIDGDTLRLRAGEFGLELRAGSEFAIEH